MTSVTWTTEKPSQPGWYWRRETSKSQYRPVEIVLAHYTGPLELWMKDNAEMRPLDTVGIEGGEWAGPLDPPPEVPE